MINKEYLNKLKDGNDDTHGPTTSVPSVPTKIWGPLMKSMKMWGPTNILPMNTPVKNTIKNVTIMQI